MILRWDRIFEPPDIKRFEGFGKPFGAAAREGPMTVECNVRSGADALSDGLDNADLVVDFNAAKMPVCTVFFVARRNVEIEFQGIVAELVDNAFGFVRTGDRIGLVGGVTVTVDANLIAVFPAEQLVGWHVKDLARQIVERNLDPGDCSDGDAANRSLTGHLLDEMLGESVDVEWVFADDERFHPLDELRCTSTPVGLAGPDDTRISVYADERPREVAINHRRLYIGDFHITAATARARDTHRFR